MKKFCTILLILLSFNSFAQRERAIDILDSNFVVVKYQGFGKDGSNSNGVKFINSETGQITKVEFDEDTNIIALEHIKLELLNIDEVLIITRKAEKKNSNVTFDSRIYMYSHNGKLKNTVSLDQHVNDYVINRKLGKIVLISTSNRMKSSLKNDEQVEIIYDLKTLKRI